MLKIRNAIAIIVLCIVAGSSYKKLPRPFLLLPPGAPAGLRDGGYHNRAGGLNMPSSDDDSLKDSLAEGPAIVTGRGISHGQPVNGGLNGNPPNPRGGTYGSVGGGSNQNPYSQTAPPVLSPSGPQ